MGTAERHSDVIAVIPLPVVTLARANASAGFPSRRTVLRLLASVPAVAYLPTKTKADTAGGDLLGTDTDYETQPNDTFVDIARRFDLGYVETVAANPGVNAWVPPPGTHLKLPTAHLMPSAKRDGIVVNIGAMRLFAFLPGQDPLTYPIGTGVDINMTPIGQTTIVRKQIHPTWIPPASIRLEKPDLPASIPPGPDNPLGDYDLVLGYGDYGIHGTDKPYGVGRHVSHGCIRLYPEDIEALFHLVSVGTRVTVINETVVFGWSNGELYMQVYPEHVQADVIEIDQAPPLMPIGDLDRLAIEAADTDWQRIDWDIVQQAAIERRATAVRITR